MFKLDFKYWFLDFMSETTRCTTFYFFKKRTSGIITIKYCHGFNISSFPLNSIKLCETQTLPKYITGTLRDTDY